MGIRLWFSIKNANHCGIQFSGTISYSAADCAFANTVAWFYQVGTGQGVLLFLNIFPHQGMVWSVFSSYSLAGSLFACAECSPLVVIF